MNEVIFAPANDRQRRTRNALAAGLSYVAGTTARGFASAKRSKPSTKSQVAKIVRAVHEPKTVDQYQSITLNGTGVAKYLLLNTIDQGTGATNRTGRQVMMDHVDINFLIETDPTNLSGDVVRFVVFVDKESRGGTPSSGEVLQYVTNSAVAAVSPMNFDNVPSRFTILADESVSVNPGASPTTTTTSAIQLMVRRRIKLNRRVHFYNTTGGGISDIDSGALWLFAWCLDATAPSGYTMYSRVVFRDL